MDLMSEFNKFREKYAQIQGVSADALKAVDHPDLEACLRDLHREMDRLVPQLEAEFPQYVEGLNQEAARLSADADELGKKADALDSRLEELRKAPPPGPPTPAPEKPVDLDLLHQVRRELLERFATAAATAKPRETAEEVWEMQSVDWKTASTTPGAPAAPKPPAAAKKTAEAPRPGSGSQKTGLTPGTEEESDVWEMRSRDWKADDSPGPEDSTE